MKINEYEILEMPEEEDNMSVIILEYALNLTENNTLNSDESEIEELNFDHKR